VAALRHALGRPDGWLDWAAPRGHVGAAISVVAARSTARQGCCAVHPPRNGRQPDRVRAEPVGARSTRARTIAVAALALLAVAHFAYAYAVSPDRPHATSDTGWFGWADQLNYQREAEALADGEIPGHDYDYELGAPEPGYDPAEDGVLSDYSYGLVYPALGVPAILLGAHTDPFVVPGALLWLATLACTARLGARLRGPTFGVVVAALVAFATPLQEFYVAPWNNTITVLAVLVALLVATDPGPTWRRAGVPLGLAVGLCFGARYFDALFPAVIGGVALAARVRGGSRQARGALVVAAAVAVALALPILWTHDQVFGSPFTTPYAYHRGDDGRTDEGLESYDLGQVPRAFTEVFVTARVDGARVVGDPVLRLFPWLAAAPLGLVALRRRRDGTALALALGFAMSIAGTVVYLSFVAGTGKDLVNHNVRYFAPWMPVWALLAAEGLVWLRGRIVATAPSPADAGGTAATGGARTDDLEAVDAAAWATPSRSGGSSSSGGPS
jgi:hypothetical protein